MWSYSLSPIAYITRINACGQRRIRVPRVSRVTSSRMVINAALAVRDLDDVEALGHTGGNSATDMDGEDRGAHQG